MKKTISINLALDTRELVLDNDISYKDIILDNIPCGDITLNTVVGGDI